MRQSSKPFWPTRSAAVGSISSELPSATISAPCVQGEAIANRRRPSSATRVSRSAMTTRYPNIADITVNSAWAAISPNSCATAICGKLKDNIHGKIQLGNPLTATATATPMIVMAVTFARRIVPAGTGSGSRIAASRGSMASTSHCEAATSAVTTIASAR